MNTILSHTVYTCVHVILSDSNNSIESEALLKERSVLLRMKEPSIS